MKIVPLTAIMAHKIFSKMLPELVIKFKVVMLVSSSLAAANQWFEGTFLAFALDPGLADWRFFHAVFADLNRKLLELQDLVARWMVDFTKDLASSLLKVSTQSLVSPSGVESSNLGSSLKCKFLSSSEMLEIVQSRYLIVETGTFSRKLSLILVCWNVSTLKSFVI